MTEQPQDAASVRIPPPFVYIAAMIVGALLHRFVVAWPLELVRNIKIGVAVGLTVLGFAFMGAAMRGFTRTGQDPKPWKPTPEIVSTGIYRFTRNPMYIGMGLVQIAMGVALANGWIAALVLPALAGVHLTAVRHEEAYLERKFGEPYLDYKKSVRRWL